MNLPKNLQEVPWAKVGVVVVTIALLAFLSSIIVSAAIGGASLLLLGVIGLVGAGLIKSTAYFGQKLDNKLLALRKAEARENPIEQKQNEYKRRQANLDQKHEALTDANTNIRNLECLLRDRLKDSPDADVSVEEHDLLTMKEAHARKVEKYQAAVVGQQKFKKVIEAEIFRWNYAQASRKVKEAMDEQNDVMASILTEESTRAIQSEYNRSFAEMDMEFASDTASEKSSLTFNPSSSLGVTDVKARTTTSNNQLGG